LICLWKRCSN